eukprot:scaffold36966_cov30-Tisochrysis_lutea.AAC.3
MERRARPQLHCHHPDYPRRTSSFFGYCATLWSISFLSRMSFSEMFAKMRETRVLSASLAKISSATYRQRLTADTRNRRRLATAAAGGDARGLRGVPVAWERFLCHRPPCQSSRSRSACMLASQ